MTERYVEEYDEFTRENDGMPITEEMLVEFLMEHGIDCAEALDDLTDLIHLVRAEANTPCGVRWDEDVTIH